jgi:hypothetical protein
LRESSTLDVRDQDLVVESVNGVAVDESNSNLNSVDNFGMESSVVAKDGSGKVNGSENIVESLQLSSIDSRLGGVLANFQNHGTVNINFNLMK